jgi:hypothetical protein
MFIMTGMSPGERKKRMVSQSPQKTSSSVPAPISYPNSFDVAVFPENEPADPYLFFNYYHRHVLLLSSSAK